MKAMAKPITAEFADAEYFKSRVQVNEASGCHEWTGKLSADGYGHVIRKSGTRQAHRVALVLRGVDVPLDAVVDHLCRNRRCVNPKHLEVTDIRTNTMRGASPIGASIRAIETGVCRRGHDVRVVGFHSSGRFRTCAQCGRDRVAAYRLRRAS